MGKTRFKLGQKVVFDQGEAALRVGQPRYIVASVISAVDDGYHAVYSLFSDGKYSATVSDYGNVLFPYSEHIALDADGTLVSRDADGELTLLQGRAAACAAWRAVGVELSVVTNQGVVGLRYWKEDARKKGYADLGEPEELPTQEKIEKRYRRLANEIDARLYMSFAYQSRKSGKWGPMPPGVGYKTTNEGQSVEVDPYSGSFDLRWAPDMRKPGTGMLVMATLDAGVAPLLIGNSGDSRKAAENFGCDYMDAEDVWPDEPQIYTFRYHPSLSHFMLTDEMRVGLDIAKTNDAFRAEVNKYLSGSYPVRNVTRFVTDDTLEKDEFHIEPNPDWAERGIRDLFINLGWLTFESAESHARAMANALTQETVNHAIVLWIYLPEKYGITNERARELEKEFKSEADWKKVRFIL